ncbi:thioesterase II family protein [Brevibacillus laterosporus]|uniref:thioesterase II family protein n=1 Tax=Brevibacillus laterosporus TaxID=1465 RepID=UPI001F08B6B0|nr:alpha/beta fold hydrolase [Brevibacillus laterosporus]
MLETDQAATPWLISHPEAKDTIRLFCLPYAGGGASAYRGWANALPRDIGVYPIQLPGRENRIGEQALCDMKALVEAISQAIYPYLDRPFLFFGHSLGARIAFELARAVRRKWKLQPCRLIVSGSRAPNIPEPHPLHHLPDDEFVSELRRFFRYSRGNFAKQGAHEPVSPGIASGFCCRRNVRVCRGSTPQMPDICILRD